MSNVDDLLKGHDQIMGSYDLMIEELNRKDLDDVVSIVSDHLMREAQIRNQILRKAGSTIPEISLDLEKYRDTLAILLKRHESN